MKESHPVVHIVGAGPGDPELLTLKGRRLLEEADLVLYAGSLVNPRILACCGPEARKVDSAPLSLEAQVDLLAEAALEGLRVVRLHTGDPSLYGAIGEQIRPLRERGVEVRLVPGVSSLQAAAAALGVEYTVPGGTQTLVCTRAPGRTPVPEAESLRVLAATGATLAVFLSAEHAPAVVASCLEAGLAPVKIDMVVRRGLNDHCVLNMARRFRGTGCILRFIEFMDVGNHNEWTLEDVVSGEDIVRQVHAVFPLEPLDPNYHGEVARRYRYADGAGEIGVVTSVTRPFCGGCSRLRLSADGQLFTCLFGKHGHDARTLLRDGSPDDVLEAWLRALWGGRRDRYSELRASEPASTGKVEMSRIGG